jgi:hypothetical protein
LKIVLKVPSVFYRAFTAFTIIITLRIKPRQLIYYPLKMLLFLLLLVLLIRSYPFYSRIEFDKFMYKITFESLARKGGIMNGGREKEILLCLTLLTSVL